MAEQQLSLAPDVLAKAKNAIEILSSLTSSVSEQSSHPATSGGSLRITHSGPSNAGPSGLSLQRKNDQGITTCLSIITF